jgi:hypothetical protein
MAYENLWREHYGGVLISAGEMLCRAGAEQGAYEVLFQLALAMASPCQADPSVLNRHR